MSKVRGAILVMLTLLCLYCLLRITFYFLYFNELIKAPGMVLRMLYWGIRLDFTTLFYINCPFFIYYLLIDNYVPQRFSRIICLTLLLALNLPFIAINIIDLAYYRFTGRRSNADLLFVAKDSLSAVPHFLKAYWYFLLLFIAIIVCLIPVLKKVTNKTKNDIRRPWYVTSVAGLVTLFLFALLARGLAGRPILPSTPLLYFDAQFQPLICNSSFTFLYSLVKRQHQLEIKNYYTKDTLDAMYPIRRQYTHKQSFQHRNVVIIILESFCREYLQNGSPYRARTPFLDSLIGQSTWCSNAYSNGVSSNQGIVSILGSMPPFLNEPYYHSIYSNNRIRGLGTILKEEGYNTHFFMGAGPDHFGFGKWCKAIGIDHYHSRNDFNNDKYYDGIWGIYDHQFLPFGAEVLKKKPNPFLAVFFTISSHDPYPIPTELQDRFNFAGQLVPVKNIAYVDYSLRLFFNSIQDTDWFRNTLFVFTADHSILPLIGEQHNLFFSYRIPIFIYDPAHPVYRNIEKPVQQTDLVPTILDQLAYSAPFMSFGHSIYDTTINRYAVYPSYQDLKEIVDSSFLLGYNDASEQPVHLYDIRHDSMLMHNLLGLPAYADIQSRLSQQIRAAIQRYNNSLIQNKLFVK